MSVDIKKLQPHALCLIPDKHTDAELAKLESSMRVQGYDASQPITLYEGRILDGWGRYKAAKLAGIEPVFVEFTGNPDSDRTVKDQAVDFAYYRALAGKRLPLGRLAALVIRYNVHRSEAGEPPLSHGQLAAMSGVSPSYIGQASSIQQRNAATLDKIIKGEQSLPRAYRELEKSVPEPIDPNVKLADVWATKRKWELVVVRLQEMAERDIDPLRSRRGSELIVESMASKRRDNGVVKLGKTIFEVTLEQIKANMPDRLCPECDGDGCDICRGRGWWTVAEAKARRQ